jgi:RHS repeat-associated protein
MKVTFAALSFALGIACACVGQENPEGWFPTAGDQPPLEAAQNEGGAIVAPGELTGGSSGNWADELTPEIQALARGLLNEPLRIFNYVRNYMGYEHYYGCKKGAQLTLLERSGNDFDQASLLVALLRAAGYQAQYQSGFLLVPYQSSSGFDIVNWWGLAPAAYTNRTLASLGYSLSDFPGAANEQVAKNFLLAYTTSRVNGWPTVLPAAGYTQCFVPRVWVLANFGSGAIWMDPAVKIYDATPRTNFNTLLGYTRTNLLSQAGGTNTANYVQNLSYANITNQLKRYTTNLLNVIRSNYPNATVRQVVGGRTVRVAEATDFSSSMPFPAQTSFSFGPVPIQSWNAIPADTNTMASVGLQIGGGLSTNLWYSELQGKRLALVFTNSRAQLWLEDALLLEETGTVSGTNVTVVTRIDHPHHTRTYTGSGGTFTNQDFKRNDQILTNTFRRTLANGTPAYALIYGFKVSPEYVRHRERKLAEYYRQGLASSSRAVVSETLNIIGLSWYLQTDLSNELLARQLDQIPLYHHRFGRTGQEEGYFIDVAVQQDGSYHASGNTNVYALTHQTKTYFASAMEHGVVEQRQGGTNRAVSTVKVFHLSNQSAQRIYKVTSANWSTVRPSLVNYGTEALDSLQAETAGGATLLLPANGNQALGQWQGFGYLQLRPNGALNMFISGGYSGGYGGDFYLLQPDTEYLLLPTQSDFVNPTPPTTPPTYAADPVNMADGSFTHNQRDLSTGLPEPRGLNFERSYASSRRDFNVANLGYGWTHNYDFDLTETTDVRAGLGLATPYEVAAYLAATYVAYDVYAGGSSAKDWVVTALIANWAVDQLKRNAVSVSLGSETIQFIRQPNGFFTAPAGVTMTLTRTNDLYELRQRHGNVFRFNSVNRLSEIEDQYGKKMIFTYFGDGRLQQVTDAYSRTLTFNYGTSNRLDSVTESTGRSIQFGYDAALNLTSATDPEGRTSTFGYDADHQLTLVTDADNRPVVRNFYDPLGRVVEQWTEANSNMLWRLYYSGVCNIEENAFGNTRSFYYDERSRSLGTADAFGLRERLVYDGQDHVVQSITALNETNTFVYDGFHNLLIARDPLGFGVTNQYDSQYRMTNVVDARGFSHRFTYNAKHQVIEARDPLGNRTTNGYSASDGTLLTQNDPGTNTTSFLYDAYAQVQRITYPGGDYEEFTRNSRGDVLVHRNTRGFFTTNTYNLRRQLASSAAVSNVTSQLSYDNTGNLIETRDARGFAISNNWSGTGKLLSETFPLTDAGAAVTRNVYDVRDWLTASVDAFGRSNRMTYFINGRLQSTVDPLQRSRNFAYYANGLKAFESDGLGRTWTFFYDARGQRVSSRPPGSSVSILHGYDANGNQTSITNLLEARTTMGYDAANRLATNRTPTGRQTIYTFDPRGLVRTVREPSGQLATNFYDARGRLTNRVDAVGSTAYAYDAGNLLLTVKEAGRTITRAYDGLGRLELYTDGESNQLRYTYDANGNLTRLQYPDGRAVTHAYDGRNQLTNVTDWAGRKTHLAYDLNGRVTQIIRPNGTRRIMTYDEAGQTRRIEERESNNRLIALFRYEYDAAGQITNRFVVPLSQYTLLPQQTSTHDGDNRLESFAPNSVGSDPLFLLHDDDGNLTEGPLTNAEPAVYTWDARNRLRNAGGVSYGYDAQNNRVAITNGGQATRFVINSAPALSQVLVRSKADGSQTFYVHGLGLLYEVSDTGSTRTYHYDYLGSTVAITDDAGQVTDRVEYGPYANITHRVGNTETPFLFNGRYGVMTDANGLLHMRARYYNPYLCRFLSEDPAGFEGGMNFYAYADGNPVSYLDPFGLGAITESFGTTWLNMARANAGWAVDQLYGSAQGMVAMGLDALGTGLDMVGTAVGNPNLGDYFSDWADAQYSGSTPAANAGWYDANDPATQAASMAVALFTRRPGRLGNSLTRQHLAEVAAEMEARGWTIIHGGGKFPEEYLPGPGGGQLGSSFVDLTATKSGRTLRVNTIDTYVDGVTPTPREAVNAARIRSQTPGDHLLLVPKPKS